MKQDQSTLAVFATAVAVLLVLVVKTYVCKFRNRHEPDADDVARFLNGSVELATKCTTCECDLVLRADPEDSELYWVIEV